MRVGTVLDQSKVVTFAEVEKCIQIGRRTSDVHGNGRPGLRRDRQRRPCPGCSRSTGIVNGKRPFAPARNEDETHWRVWRNPTLLYLSIVPLVTLAALPAADDNVDGWIRERRVTS